MKVLVLGATGQTGGRVLEQLLAKGHGVRAIVRSREKVPAALRAQAALELLEASLLDLSEAELAEQVRDCDAVVSCLGHVLSLKGVFGAPRKLCVEAARRVCEAIERSGAATRFILMNTVGAGDPALEEPRTLFDRALLWVLRYTLPPHRDNELAAEYLHQRGRAGLEWCSVRPDALIDAEVSAYTVAPSPSTTILGGRPTTRANVAHFMVSLIEDARRWSEWRFRMPVITNAD